jgi:hypothetical protein
MITRKIYRVLLMPRWCLCPGEKGSLQPLFSGLMKINILNIFYQAPLVRMMQQKELYCVKCTVICCGQPAQLPEKGAEARHDGYGCGSGCDCDRGCDCVFSTFVLTPPT